MIVIYLCVVCTMALGSSEVSEDAAFNFDEWQLCVEWQEKVMDDFINGTLAEEEFTAQLQSDQNCKNAQRKFPGRDTSNQDQETNIQRRMQQYEESIKAKIDQVWTLRVTEYAACLNETDRMLLQIANKTFDHYTFGCEESKNVAHSSAKLGNHSKNRALLAKLEKNTLDELYFRFLVSTYIRCLKAYIQAWKNVSNLTRESARIAIKDVHQNQNCDPMLGMWMAGKGGTRAYAEYPEIKAFEKDLESLEPDS